MTNRPQPWEVGNSAEFTDNVSAVLDTGNQPTALGGVNGEAHPASTQQTEKFTYKIRIQRTDFSLKMGTG